MKHHSYTGGSALGVPSPYLNFQTLMNNTTTNNHTAAGYQKFMDQTTAASGIDRGATSNITAEEIATLYSNVLATQTIIHGKRNQNSAI